MKQPACGMIQDLLLSYCDGLTGESVTGMIQEHLAECPKCQGQYEEIKRQLQMAENAELTRGQNFADKLKSIRHYVIGFGIGLTLPVAALVVWYLLGALSNYVMIYFMP